MKHELEQRLTAGWSVWLCSLNELGMSRWLREWEYKGREVLKFDGVRDVLALTQLVKTKTDMPTTVVIDHFDWLLRHEDRIWFERLRAWRNAYKENLNFLVGTSETFDLLTYIEKLGGFYELISESKLHFPAGDSHDAREMISVLLAKSDIRLGEIDESEVIRLSGGIAGLVKSYFVNCVNGMEGNEFSDRVRGVCMRVWQSLPDVQRENLKMLLRERSIRDERLEAWGLIDDKGIRSGWLKSWVEKQSSMAGEQAFFEMEERLTKIELQIFTLLRDRAPRLCSREDLLLAGWPEDNVEGVSDQALDQVISRIRKKLRDSMLRIDAMKGRGYMLVSR